MKQNKALEAVILANIFCHTNIEAAILTRIFSQTNKPVSKRSTTEMDTIQKGTEVLYQQLEQALARIKDNVQKNRELAEQIARSPGQSKQSRIWRPPSQHLLLQNQSQNTKFPNMPQEIGVGNTLPSSTRSLFKIYSIRISRPDKGPTKFWARKLRKSCYRTNYWPSRPPAFMTARQKNSIKVPS
jgi:hypothetical protein